MKSYVLILILALALLFAAMGMAAANGNVELPRQVMSGGATDAVAGGVTLHATLGQPMAGIVANGEMTLEQGFWHGSDVGFNVYLPLVIR